MIAFYAIVLFIAVVIGVAYFITRLMSFLIDN